MLRDVSAVSRQFGHNLAEARRSAGLSQTELGRRIFMAQPGISRWESGECCPRLDMAVLLADALGLQVRDLLYGIE